MLTFIDQTIISIILLLTMMIRPEASIVGVAVSECTSRDHSNIPFDFNACIAPPAGTYMILRSETKMKHENK